MKTGTRIKGMIGAACIAVMIAALAGTGGTQKVSADGVTQTGVSAGDRHRAEKGDHCLAQGRIGSYPSAGG